MASRLGRLRYVPVSFRFSSLSIRFALSRLTSRHVNNTHYVKWFEAARIQYIENIDLPNDDAKKLLVSYPPFQYGYAT